MTERLKGCVVPFVVAVGIVVTLGSTMHALGSSVVTELNTSSIVGGCSSASTITRDSTTAFITRRSTPSAPRTP